MKRFSGKHEESDAGSGHTGDQPQVSATYARSLIEASLDPLVTISPDGKITDVNEATIKVTGVRREQLIGTDFSTYFTEPEKAREGYRQVFEKGFVTDYPLTIRHKDVRLTDVLYNASVYKDTRGNVLGVFAAARDITAQRQASQYARSLIEASLDPLVTISPDGKITDVNEATVRVTGVPREQLIGSDFSDYFTEPDKAREGYRQVFAKGFVTDYPLTIRHKDGRLTEVLYNASVYKDVRGNVLGVFAAARDVTESTRVMREYAETKNFLDNILQSSIKYSIIGKDLNQRILSWNEGAQRTYGYRAEEILGKDSKVLHTPEDIESGVVKTLLATAYEKGLAEGEFQRVRKDGSRFTANVVVTRRNDASGTPIGYLLMSSDISERKQAEERLQSASQYARSLIEASLDPLVTISPDGKITDVNETTAKVTGVFREQLIGSDFSDYFTEPDKAREGYRQVFEKGFVTDYPLTIRHKNGKLTHVLYNASVYKDVRGNVLGVFAAARDITVQKQAEEELQRAHSELELRVQERTAELAKANEALQAEIAERERAEQVIRALSTPVLQVREGMLILPIIGIIDSQRARQLTEQLLRAIRDNRARVAVVDITGVPAVDSKIANHLLQTSEAARLMGATVILTGLSPDVAQALVAIGVDLSRLTTVADLQGGIAKADQQLGYRVVRQEEATQGGRA